MSPGWLDKGKFIPGLVSVIIPTFNRAAYLKEAIDSVINQTYRPIECIIVDDGSTDNTRELVSSIDTDIELRYLYQANAGSQAARNKGTLASNGEFIQYLDSDDILYPEKIKHQADYLIANKNCDGVFGDWQTGTETDNKKITSYKSSDFIEQVFIENSIVIFSFLMRRNIIDKIGEWDVAVLRNQEIDYHLRGILAGASFNYSSNLCGLWRVHHGDRIANKTSLDAVIQFYQKWENLLKLKEHWTEKYANGIVRNYMWFLSQYFDSEEKALQRMLLEVKRLQPEHPIFTNSKFKIANHVLGTKRTLWFWIKRYKKRMSELRV